MIGVDGVDIGADRRVQFGGGAVDAAADLPFGDVEEEALDLIDPGTGGEREVKMPSRPRAEPFSDRLCLVSGLIVHNQVNVETVRHVALDLAQEAQELAAEMAG